MEFKDKLKALRNERHLSQQQLANAIFVSRSAVAKWENGLGIPSDSSYKALLDFLGLTKEELPLNSEIEEISITKNKKIRTLSAIVIIIAAILLAVIITVVAVLVLSPQNRMKAYDWDKVDALLIEMGKENNVYFPSGDLALEGKMIEIYYNKDTKYETFVRLTKYRTQSEDYYKLLFDRHYYNLVEGKIVTASYACSFHYQGDIAYNLELADVNYFIGDTESFDVMRQCGTYQVKDKKFENGQFISCSLEAVSTFGFGESLDADFHLPGGDQKFIEEIMKFGFEKTTEFFENHNLVTPY